jgi:hypothetical protein
MLTLHHLNDSRSQRIELGTLYEMVRHLRNSETTPAKQKWLRRSTSSDPIRTSPPYCRACRRPPPSGIRSRRAGRTSQRPSRQKTNFSNRINAILPVQSPSAKIFRFAIPPNQIDNHRIPSRSEGRFAIVTDVGTGCGGREGGARRAWLMRTAKSCGPGAPKQALSRRKQFCR